METTFRIRHLQSVNVRSLNVPDDDLHRSSVFFALSTADKDNLGYFFESGKCDNVLNPYWENLDLSYESIKKFSYLDNFIITFFVNKNSKNKLLVEIKVNITGLTPLLDLPSYHLKKDDNYFLFQFNNSIYSFDIAEPSVRSKISIDTSKKYKIEKAMYSRDTIHKFISILSSEHQQVINSLPTKRNNLESRIYDCKNEIISINTKKSSIANIESQMQLAQRIRDAKTKHLFQIRLSNTILKEKIEKALECSVNAVVDISKHNSLLKRHRPAYEKISNEYMLRVYQLIHELARIFPITPTIVTTPSISKPNGLPTNNANLTTITIKGNDKLSIVNLHLPNGDRDIILTQDVNSFAALGMVYRLLNALSQIYDIPLRYPLHSIGVKTMIRDNIIDIEDSERNFLLIKNNSENFRLQYAIYLLNLNIVAIRGYFSLITKNPDRTLWNINTLIEGKNRILGSSDGESNTASNGNLPSPQNNSPHSPRFPPKMSPLVTKGSSAIY